MLMKVFSCIDARTLLIPIHRTDCACCSCCSSGLITCHIKTMNPYSDWLRKKKKIVLLFKMLVQKGLVAGIHWRENCRKVLLGYLYLASVNILIQINRQTVLRDIIASLADLRRMYTCVYSNAITLGCARPFQHFSSCRNISIVRR